MTDAGRIGFVIKGDYDNTETYEFLDVVYYNGSSYVAKKITKGNVPDKDTEFWHILVNVNLNELVTSFNGRKGNIQPSQDDYAIEQIKAIGATGQIPVLNTDGKFEMQDAPAEDGITTSSGTALSGSKSGGLKIVELSGRQSKNLLENTATSQTIYGVTFTVNADGSVTANGTASSLINFVFTRNFNTNGDVIFSMGQKGGNDTFKTFISAEDGSGDIASTGSSDSVQFSTDKTYQVHLIVYDGATLNNLTFYPMIRLASIEDDTYEPYGFSTVDTIKTVGKNLLKNTATSRTVNGVTFTVNSDGSVKVKGTATANTYLSLLTPSNGVNLEAGTYVLSGFTSEFSGFISIPNEENSKFIGIQRSANEATFTVNGKEENIRYELRVSEGQTVNDVTIYPMVRRADITDDTYEPYQESTVQLSSPVTLYGIDDVKDRIVERDGVLGVERKYGKAVFDGSDDEDWVSGNTGTNGKVRFIIKINYVMPVINQITKFIGWANIRAVTARNTYDLIEGIGVDQTARFVIYIDDVSSGTVADFKSWLASNPVTVIYKLTTPAFEPLPAADQISLRSLKTFNEVTYIQFDESKVKPDMSVEYGITKTSGYTLEALNKADSILIDEKIPKVYGFHIDGSESDPYSMVEYLEDARYMMPAHMDYTKGVFDYGSWEDVWFVKDAKPCILNQDGTVKAYLNKDDYTKDVDGNAVVIDSTLTGANVMIEFPKIWYKVVPDKDDDSSASVYISPIKLDNGYKDYAYIDYQGNHKEHFYMAAYNGSNVANVMRSLSGMAVSKRLNAQTEINYCKANGDGWFTEDAGEIMLINFLLILMGKSTDAQTVFGRGIDTGGETALNNYRTGTGNTKGFFWGSNDGTQLVKVFGIENWWGLQWRRYAGDILDNGKLKIKLCYGNEDGSVVLDFNLAGEGYVDVGVTPSGTSSGYISRMKFSDSGMYSVVSIGSSTTYYTSGQWFANSGVQYALRGGASGNGLRVGALCVSRSAAVSLADWATGASPSRK